MNMQMLSELAEKGEIRELELLSLEGGFYIARVRLAHVEATLLDWRRHCKFWLPSPVVWAAWEGKPFTPYG